MVQPSKLVFGHFTNKKNHVFNDFASGHIISLKKKTSH